MATMHGGAALPRPQAGSNSPSIPIDHLADAADMALAEESADVNCIRELVAMAEHSAGLVDDGMNATEASEERHAFAEAQAMH